MNFMLNYPLSARQTWKGNRYGLNHAGCWRPEVFTLDYLLLLCTQMFVTGYSLSTFKGINFSTNFVNSDLPQNVSAICQFNSSLPFQISYLPLYKKKSYLSFIYCLTMWKFQGTIPEGIAPKFLVGKAKSVLEEGVCSFMMLVTSSW